MHRKNRWLVGALVGFCSACQPHASDTHHEPRNTDHNAQQVLRDQRDQVGKAAAEVRAKAKDVAQKAGEELSDAKSELHTWGREQLATLDADMDALRSKAQRARSNARAHVDATLRDVEAQRNALAKELKEMRAEGKTQLHEIKRDVDRRIARLERRVAALRKQL